MPRESKPTKPPRSRGRRILASLGRILFLLVAILGWLYWWNPQKLHYPRKKPPVPNPRIDPDSKRLFANGTRVTVVSAHPDDTEFYISGTLLKLAKAGAKITIIVVTDGDKSYYPPFTTDVAENRRVRRLEQERAGQAYGAKVVMLGGPDGRYNPDETKLRQKLRDAIQESKPDYLFAFESDYLPTVQHRDHENTGRAATELAKDIGADWLLLYATMANNYYVDTTGTWDQRSELLAIHASQFYGEKLKRIRGFVMDKAFTDGEEIGTETAEGFRVVLLR
jgi:LmbE family N-acetylglucosaminyl deacetylase